MKLEANSFTTQLIKKCSWWKINEFGAIWCRIALKFVNKYINC